MTLDSGTYGLLEINLFLKKSAFLRKQSKFLLIHMILKLVSKMYKNII